MNRDDDIQATPYAELWQAELGRPVPEYHEPPPMTEFQRRADEFYRAAAARRRTLRAIERRRLREGRRT